MPLAPEQVAPALPTRRARLAALGLGVALLHLWLVDRQLENRLGDGAASSRPTRIEVAFVRVLAPTAPPPAPAAVRPPPRPSLAALPPLAAASAPDPEPLAPVTSADLAPPLPDRMEALPPLATLVPPEVASAPAAAASTPFEWPPSTRLSYTLTGDFRGPVQGQAQVEWLRMGTRYQVNLDISVGPTFAPLMSRRITSEGEITASGLQPRRYDEETRVVLRDTRRLTIWLDADRVRLPAGAELPRPAGVQDSASQFVQMTWLFTQQPDLLQAGRSVEIPLALPRRVEPWIYDVLETETLNTPAGPVQAVHVKPRRDGKAGSELTAELWVAPSLQYLPVRILIRQDAQSYVDLLIERLPQQAERGR